MLFSNNRVETSDWMRTEKEVEVRRGSERSQLLPTSECLYTGFYAEIVGLIFEHLGIRYRLTDIKGDFGSYNATTDTFDGALGDIQQGVTWEVCRQ